MVVGVAIRCAKVLGFGASPGHYSGDSSRQWSGQRKSSCTVGCIFCTVVTGCETAAYTWEYHCLCLRSVKT